MKKGTLIFNLIVLAGFMLPAHAAPLKTGSDRDCLRCHAQAVNWDQWTHSAHYKAGMTCTICHQGADKPNHRAADVKKPACTDCHYYWKDKAKEFKDSVHAKNNLNCTSCHNPHAAKVMTPTTNQDFAARCTTCHKGDPVKLHSFMPQAKIHLAQHSCTVCHANVHTIGTKKDNTVTCSSCHPGKELVNKVIKKHEFFPRVNLHMEKLNCENCHRPKGPINTCETCHSSNTVLDATHKPYWISNNECREKYGYVIGANHVEWLDWLGILMFLGALGVWFFHGGLRILAGMARKGRKQ